MALNTKVRKRPEININNINKKQNATEFETIKLQTIYEKIGTEG